MKYEIKYFLFLTSTWNSFIIKAKNNSLYEYEKHISY